MKYPSEHTHSFKSTAPVAMVVINNEALDALCVALRVLVHAFGARVALGVRPLPTISKPTSHWHWSEPSAAYVCAKPGRQRQSVMLSEETFRVVENSGHGRHAVAKS